MNHLSITQQISRIGRRGFTLPEVLVSIALVAILAAAVVPTVVGQLKKGDSGRIGGDLLGIRGAIEQFVGDVRKYPGNIGQLTAPLTTSMTQLKSANTFTGTDVSRWHGPYLSKDSIAARITAYGDSMVGVFDTVTLATSGTTSAAGTKYLVVLIPGVDTLTAATLDNLFDDGNVLTGFIRWRKNPGSARDTLKMLAMPLQ